MGVFDRVVSADVESVFYVADKNITIVNNPFVAICDYLLVMTFFNVRVDGDIIARSEFIFFVFVFINYLEIENDKSQ